MTTLNIGPELSLPLDAVTETFGILAKRGSGKTYTAAVMVEEMLATGLPVCVVDPIGVWWGLRSSADGKKPGEPVVIFGGDHADVPLNETSGELIADVLVEQRIPAVLDLSLLSKSASRRFMVDFAERLYHRNREPLHLVVDEADAFAPQRAQHGGERLLGAMEDLVRRGRARGLGVTMITQRPAVLNKDVLTQIEVLVVLRMTGPKDVQAIDEWVRLHADEDEARAVKASLPSLPIGTAWVWSPGWLGVLEKVHVRKRRTFDSSATPKAGEVRVTPKASAEIDLAALGARIEATVEQAKADDPKSLRARIRELEREAAKVPEPVIERVVVPAIDDYTVHRLEEMWRDFAKASSDVAALGDEIRTQLATIRSPAAASPAPARRVMSTPDRPASTPRTAKIQPVDDSDVRLGKTERVILSTLVQHGNLTHSQLALLAGYSAKASTIGVALAKLRKIGMVEPGNNPIRTTDAGVNYIGDNVEPLPQGDALLDYWRNRFGGTERNVLDALIQLWPNDGSQVQVAELTGYSPTASTIGVAASKLRKVGVVDRWRLSDDFANAVGL